MDAGQIGRHDLFQKVSASGLQVKPINLDRQLFGARKVERATVAAPTNDLVFALQILNWLRRTTFHRVERELTLSIRSDDPLAVWRDKSSVPRGCGCTVRRDSARRPAVDALDVVAPVVARLPSLEDDSLPIGKPVRRVSVFLDWTAR